LKSPTATALLRSALLASTFLIYACGEQPAGTAEAPADPTSVEESSVVEPDEPRPPAPRESPAPETVPQQTPAAAPAAVSAGITTRATELKRAPAIESEVSAMLATSTRLAILERKGGWYRVVVDEQEGWVRMLHVTRSRAADTAGTNELDTAVAIATGRAGAGNVVATTGIRGFSEEQLQTAEPDMAALTRLDGFEVTPAQAAAAAKARDLVPHKIKYLAEPPR